MSATQRHMNEDEMRVKKRDGKLETISFDKILKRIKTIGQEAAIKINYTTLVMKVIDQLFDGICTTKIDELMAEQCASMASIHPDYNVLAGRLIISNHHKNTDASFSTAMRKLYENKDIHNMQSPLVSNELIEIVNANSALLDTICNYDRDYLIDYFGFKTLERAYLMRVNKVVVERIQHMWMRVSLGIHGNDLEKVFETYEYMSQKYFTHATPTLFNAGTPRQQLSSCFLLAMENDSIDGIYNTLKDCALISKLAGGIGLHIHNVRATGSYIRGTNGTSNGIVPMLRVFNNTAKYVDQCVPGHTVIYTTEGPMRIDNCIAGETRVYNALGQSEVIQNVLEHAINPEIKLLNIIMKDPYKSSLKITEQHPVVVFRDGDYQWVDARDLEVGDRMVSVIPKYAPIDSPELKEMDCIMYGIVWNYCVDSPFYLSVKPRNGNVEKCNEILDFVCEYFKYYCIEYVESNTNNICYIRWKGNTVCPLRSNYFFTNHCQTTDGQTPDCKTKKMPAKILNLPKEKLELVMKYIEPIRNNPSLEFLKLRLSKPDEFMDGIPVVYNEIEFIENIEPREGTILYDLQMKDEHNYLLEAGLVHNGGGKRNGSFAIYLEPWHADIEAFLEMRKNHGDEEQKARDLFYALWIPDLFMKRIQENGKWTLMCPDECPGLADVYGEEFEELYEKYESSGKGRRTVNARDLWFKVLDAQMETGTPYLCYKDAANKKSNQKNIGTIKSSNLCVAPETLVLTENGHLPIESLKDQTVKIWNGNEWSEVVVRKTGIERELIDVFTDDGMKITCTPYHKFYIQNSYSKKSLKIVDARNLSPNDKIIKCSYPIIDGTNEFMYPYTHGFFCGDGTYRKVSDTPIIQCKYKSLKSHHFCKRHIYKETEFYKRTHDITLNENNICKSMSNEKIPILFLYDEKKKLIDHIEYRGKENNSCDRIVLNMPGDLPEKYTIPPHNCSLKTKLEWFAGYCDADGCISKNGSNKQLQVASINYEFLQNIKLMLQTCGINPKIKKMRDNDMTYLPNGKNGYCLYNVKTCYRLLITSCDLFSLVKNGFNPKRLNIENINEPARNANQFIKIIKIQNDNRIDDTYCFTEPKRHMGVFNGILTGQCTEIMEVSTSSETAVCNLASIALPTFVDEQTKTFDFDKLHKITKIVTKNLNRVIDINYYPTEKTHRSNMNHRPIGIGVQGLADTFMMLGQTFASDYAKKLNQDIFETIYHGALEASCELAKVQGPYESFAGSPSSKGILQFDMWNVKPSERYNWEELKLEICKTGLRNSLLVAPMPTASTSQILGFNECIEPITSNIYSRRTSAGEFILANKYMMRDLIDLGLWSDAVKNNIIANNGSIQHLTQIPQEIRDRYRTVWEIPMRTLIDMSADRGAFVCQSQSLNLWLEDPNYKTLTSMHFYGWQKGLKTGIYYLRRRGRHQAQQFTIEPEKAQHGGKQVENENEHEICEFCSA